ncbi:glycosyltransferase [Streptomyces sp. NPDC059786]|uniref:glycosyltransferase n=1 Tax=Streptomyces sp. NPDC059786 TaxID=3346946 RepID=UPI00364AAFFE
MCITRPSKYLMHPSWLPKSSICRIPYLTLGMLSIMLQRLWQICTVVPRVNVVLLQKDLLFRSRLRFLERLLFLIARLRNVRVVFDIDDAIYLGSAHEPTPHMLPKIAYIARSSALVLAGSEPIAARLVPHAADVRIFPTCIDAGERPARDYETTGGVLRLVWAGTPTNAWYLKQMTDALVTVRNVVPLQIELVSRLDELPPALLEGFSLKLTEWSEEREKDALLRADIALAPLADDDWTRAKCGGKILGYFASGLPVVASPVGAQAKMVRHGETGMQATSDEEWADALLTLSGNKELRERVGTAGRNYLESTLDTEKRYTEWRGHVMGDFDVEDSE